MPIATELKSLTKPDLVFLAELAVILLQHGPRGMAETLLKYRANYVPSIAYSGRKSLNNGDAIAQFLSGAEPAVVATQCETILGLEPGFLTERYLGLNPGQIRMNSGNRLRAAIKRGDISATDLH
jgi:hypothetical protein